MSKTVSIPIRAHFNGNAVEREVEPRLLLSDFIRHGLGLTGTHVGCEQGVCGACTVLFDGSPVRACLMLAAQAHGHHIHTVESLAPRGPLGATAQADPVPDEALHPLQAAFRREHALQCGYCTPGILMTMKAFLERCPDPTELDVREALSGNLCRCTGYQNIVSAVIRAGAVLRAKPTGS